VPFLFYHLARSLLLISTTLSTKESFPNGLF
jgi:hypothetical protein